MQTDDDSHPQRVQLRRGRYAQQALAPGSQVISGGLGGFRAFDTPLYVHYRHITGGGPVGGTPSSTGSTPVKNAITGTYQAIRGQHAPRYLAEFEYRFNRRYDLKAMIPRFLTVAARTPPMPYRFLKLAEPYA